jgi:hypothetical protein
MKRSEKATRVAPSACTGCGRLHDAVTPAIGQASPEPGSITMCIYCGHIAAFDDDLKLRELTREEQIEIAGDERILAVQRARLQFRQ